jgi:Xaa-Pro aminopeptidase
MRTMHPTLLIGPADWDASCWPREEFTARLAALWQDHPDASGAIVYGNAADHAGLAYLTHFTPKLEAALALIPREGAPRLLVGGGANMLTAARPLTFVEDLRLLRGADDAAEWVQALPSARCLLIGGDAMPYDLRCAFMAALGPRALLSNGDDGLRARMRNKSSRELAAIRTACGTLEAAVSALRTAFRAGDSVTDCVLAAEHGALQRGAQDVRSLFAFDRGRTLRPFDGRTSEHVDPLLVYLAVRQNGYWAEAYVLLSNEHNPLQAAAQQAVEAMVAAVRPGLSSTELWQILERAGGKLRHHPLTSVVFGNSIGLALDEQLPLTRDDDARFAPGDVCSLRAGFVDGNGSGAIASAMLVVTDAGHQCIWPPTATSTVVS